MPFRKKTQRRKRRAPKVRIQRNQLRLMPQQMKYKVYRFKRDLERTLDLSGTTPTGWYPVDNMFTSTLGYSLDSLDNYGEFVGNINQPGNGLFKQYRLLGVRLRIYASNTQSSTTTKAPNAQIIVRMAANNSGKVQANNMNISYWEQLQRKKYRTLLNGGRPLDIYFPLSQLKEVVSTGANMTAMSKPRFIDTTNPGVIHYGLNIALGRADGQAFTSNLTNSQHLRLIQTVYFECRGVE